MRPLSCLIASCVCLACLLAAPRILAEEPAAPAATAEPAAVPGLPSVDELLAQAKESIGKVQDYTAHMTKQERFKDGVLRKEVVRFKFARPFKVYIKFLEPYVGREVIFNQGANDNEVRVHKGSFPDLTVNLDPRGGMAMENNHHPVVHFGLENTIKLAEINLSLAHKRGEGEFKVTDGGEVGGRPTWKIEASFPMGGYYTEAKDDETLWNISERTMQDMYLILYTNKEFDDPDDPDEGDKVFIPRYYGKKAEFFLDKETKLPIRVRIWDWNGKLYEEFEYKEVKLNPGLTAKDFDSSNPEYKF
jgi:outer membrane lipoprotein-sorting protein